MGDTRGQSKDPPRKILFLCTGNSCRSQMAEAILRHLGQDRFEAYSAGSHPAGFVHDLTYEALARLEIPADELRSKSWDEFADTEFDAILTLCEQAAAEACPLWEGPSTTSAWTLPDPAYHPGKPDERVEFAVRVARRLQAKIEALLVLDFTLPREELQGRLDGLGEI